MANPSNTGDQKVWYEGQPARSGATSSYNTGSQQFWFEGQPVKYVNAPSTTAKNYSFIID